MTVENEIVVMPETADNTHLAIYREPSAVLLEARKAAKALTSVISGKANPVKFNGEQYLEFEDWQTVSQFYGCTVRTGDAQLIEIDGVKGMKAYAEVVNRDGRIIGRAESFCMRDEKNWATKPLFQLASMAQTRAGSKAQRNVFSWVVVLGGYKGTPAEEMEEVFHEPKEPTKKYSPPIAPAREVIAASIGAVVNKEPGAVDSISLVGEITDWLGLMNEGDPVKMDAQLKEITTYPSKKIGEEGKLRWSKVADLQAISTKLPWKIQKIHEQVGALYSAWSAQH